MLEAMQPSSESAPAFLASFSTSAWTLGETVAQLMNSLPLAFWSRLSADLAGPKILSMALSSVTTVMTISDNSVTRASREHASASNSLATDWAVSGRASYTAAIG